MRPRLTLILTLGLAALLGQAPASKADESTVKPPEGFVALFNGTDLAGWHGMPHFDPKDLSKMSEEKRAAQIATWTEDAKKHWSVKDGDLINDGHGAYLTTDKEFGDIELLIDYKTVAKADSGIYLRGTPQVQIWDYTKEGGKHDLGADKGSGGLWNNSPGAPGKDPLVLADKPFGEWNSLRIIQIGARTTVYLNGKLVVDNAPMENYFDRSCAAPSQGPDPAPDPRRRDPLEEHLRPRDQAVRGEQDPRLEGVRRVRDHLRRHVHQGLGGCDQQL